MNQEIIQPKKKTPPPNDQINENTQVHVIWFVCLSNTTEDGNHL